MRPLTSGSPEVEQDHLGLLGENVLEAGHAGRRGRYGVATLAQSAAHRVADRIVVLDDQNAGHVGKLANFRCERAENTARGGHR